MLTKSDASHRWLFYSFYSDKQSLVFRLKNRKTLLDGRPKPHATNFSKTADLKKPQFQM